MLYRLPLYFYNRLNIIFIFSKQYKTALLVKLFLLINPVLDPVITGADPGSLESSSEPPESPMDPPLYQKVFLIRKATDMYLLNREVNRN